MGHGFAISSSSIVHSRSPPARARARHTSSPIFCHLRIIFQLHSTSPDSRSRPSSSGIRQAHNMHTPRANAKHHVECFGIIEILFFTSRWLMDSQIIYTCTSQYINIHVGRNYLQLIKREIWTEKSDGQLCGRVECFDLCLFGWSPVIAATRRCCFNASDGLEPIHF